MTFKEFVEKHKIQMTTTVVPENPYMEEMTKGSQHLHCKFTFPRNPPLNKEDELTTYYSRGPGHQKANGCWLKVEAHEVLTCLSFDASVLETSSFEDWAGDFGYDLDSRKAHQTYTVCMAHAKKLREWLGVERFNELRECEEA